MEQMMLRMESNFGVFNVCIDDEGFIWIDEISVAENLNMPRSQFLPTAIKEQYLAQDWCVFRDFIRDFAFYSPIYYKSTFYAQDFVWWACPRYGRKDFADYIQGGFEEGLHMFMMDTYGKSSIR